MAYACVWWMRRTLNIASRWSRGSRALAGIAEAETVALSRAESDKTIDEDFIGVVGKYA